MTGKIFFLVDGRKVEAQSIYLATSLARYLPVGWTATAMIRSDYLPKVSPLALEILKTCDIAVTELVCDLTGCQPWGQAYPIGNKILAAAQMPAEGSFLFLDTDMVVLKRLDFSALSDPNAIYANRSDYICGIDAPVDEHEDYWRRYYSFLGSVLPEQRIRLRGARKRLYMPYFNAGFLLFHNRPQTEAGHFGKAWLADAVRFEAGCDVPFPRVNIDQITLPITALKAHRDIVEVEDGFNLNIARKAQSEGGESIIHYHDLLNLYSYSRIEEIMENTIEVIGKPEFAAFLRQFPRETKIRQIKRFFK